MCDGWACASAAGSSCVANSDAITAGGVRGGDKGRQEDEAGLSRAQVAVEDVVQLGAGRRAWLLGRWREGAGREAGKARVCVCVLGIEGGYLCQSLAGQRSKG